MSQVLQFSGMLRLQLGNLPSEIVLSGLRAILFLQMCLFQSFELACVLSFLFVQFLLVTCRECIHVGFVLSQFLFQDVFLPLMRFLERHQLVSKLQATRTGRSRCCSRNIIIVCCLLQLLKVPVCRMWVFGTTELEFLGLNSRSGGLT